MEELLKELLKDKKIDNISVVREKTGDTEREEISVCFDEPLEIAKARPYVIFYYMTKTGTNVYFDGTYVNGIPHFVEDKEKAILYPDNQNATEALEEQREKMPNKFIIAQTVYI